MEKSNMKELLSIHGELMIVDEQDYEKAKQYRWLTISGSKGGRPQVYTYLKGEKRKAVSYKNLILGIKSKTTLFRNDNPFDLRRENIEIFDTRSEFISAIGKRYRKEHTGFDIKRAKAAQGKGGKSTKKTRYIWSAL